MLTSGRDQPGPARPVRRQGETLPSGGPPWPAYRQGDPRGPGYGQDRGGYGQDGYGQGDLRDGYGGSGDDARQAHARHAQPGRAAPSLTSRWAGPLPLVAILVVQALLAMHLIWSNTAFQDEALYLWAGHLQWTFWLEGIPNSAGFSSYFSGAPVVYPPLGALADSVGGLAAARLLSMVLILLTTALLWSATRRLFGHRAALFAAAVFAVIGSTQFISALATYDAMSLMLLAAGAWCAVRSGYAARRGQILLIAAMTACLTLANASKYGSVMWDPIVLALAALSDVRARGWRSGIGIGVAATAMATAVIAAVLALAGPTYLGGVQFTTLSRKVGPTPPAAVLQNGAWWIGAVVLLAIGGAVIVTIKRPERGFALLGWILVLAVVLAPIAQARIHTNVSLFKHVAYGGWFAAIIVGYGLSAVTSQARRWLRYLGAGGTAVALAVLGVAGAITASGHFGSWVNSAALVARVGPLKTQSPGPALAEEPTLLEYYLKSPDADWSSTFYLRYVDPENHEVLYGLPAYSDAIRHHYFAIVVLGYITTTVRTDQAIQADLERNHDYHLVAAVPWAGNGKSGRYLIWRYEPAPGK